MPIIVSSYVIWKMMRVHTGDNVVVAPSQTINNQGDSTDAIRYVEVMQHYALGYKIIALCSNRGKP